MNFSYKFRIWEYIHNTNSVYLPKLQKKECCVEVQFEFVEMHTIPLDPYLIGIVVWWVFDSNSLNLEVYLNTLAIVCISWVWVYWCYTSHATIFQSYMWRHRCAGGLKKKLYLQLGSQRHRHFAGFFNMPVLHRHGTNLFIPWFRHIAPFSCLKRHAGDTEDVFST